MSIPLGPRTTVECRSVMAQIFAAIDQSNANIDRIHDEIVRIKTDSDALKAETRAILSEIVEQQVSKNHMEGAN